MTTLLRIRWKGVDTGEQSPSKREQVTPFVVSGMATLVILLVLPSLGSVVARTLHLPQAAGFGIGLLAALVLSRAITRWAVSRPLG